MPPIRVEGRVRGGSNSLSIYSLRGAGISAPRSIQRTCSGILCLLDRRLSLTIQPASLSVISSLTCITSGGGAKLRLIRKGSVKHEETLINPVFRHSRESGTKAHSAMNARGASRRVSAANNPLGSDPFAVKVCITIYPLKFYQSAC